MPHHSQRISFLATRPILVLFCTIALSTLAACGGNKVLKEPVPLSLQQPIAQVSDDVLTTTLDWIIVRGGPGTWARNAAWDEYLLRVRNHSEASVEVHYVVVIDSSHHAHEARHDRKALTHASKQVSKRYAEQDLEVDAGFGSATLLVSAGITAGVGMAASGAALAYGSTAAAGTAIAAIVMAPVLLVGGVVVGVNNRKVNGEIGRRYSRFPVTLAAAESRELDLFFPVAPSPQRIEVAYRDAGGDHLMTLDTSVALAGLHLRDGAEQVQPAR